MDGGAKKEKKTFSASCLLLEANCYSNNFSRILSLIQETVIQQTIAVLLWRCFEYINHTQEHTELLVEYHSATKKENFFPAPGIK